MQLYGSSYAFDNGKSLAARPLGKHVGFQGVGRAAPTGKSFSARHGPTVNRLLTHWWKVVNTMVGLLSDGNYGAELPALDPTGRYKIGTRRGNSNNGVHLEDAEDVQIGSAGEHGDVVVSGNGGAGIVLESCQSPRILNTIVGQGTLHSYRSSQRNGTVNVALGINFDHLFLCAPFTLSVLTMPAALSWP